MEIKIYGRPNCAHCERAKTFLDIRKVKHTYIDLMDLSVEKRRQVVDESGMRTVPMVKVDNIFIGGADQLEMYINGLVD